MDSSRISPSMILIRSTRDRSPARLARFRTSLGSVNNSKSWGGSLALDQNMIAVDKRIKLDHILPRSNPPGRIPGLTLCGVGLKFRVKHVCSRPRQVFPLFSESRHGIASSTGPGRRDRLVAPCSQAARGDSAGRNGWSRRSSRGDGAAARRGGRVIGLDRDPKMLALAARRPSETRVCQSRSHSSTRLIPKCLKFSRSWESMACMGSSWTSASHPTSSRRMNVASAFRRRGRSTCGSTPTEAVATAADLINQLREVELANLFFEFGEERFSRRIARRIVEERKNEPIRTAGQLAAIVRRAIPGRARAGSIDPATRVFQSLRIAVNNELGELEKALAAIPRLLVPGGRAAVVSFHSLEDRRVKWAFKTHPELKVLTKKPVTASAQELAVNPRARSAKLRVVEKCPNPS